MTTHSMGGAGSSNFSNSGSLAQLFQALLISLVFPPLRIFFRRKMKNTRQYTCAAFHLMRVKLDLILAFLLHPVPGSSKRMNDLRYHVTSNSRNLAVMIESRSLFTMIAFVGATRGCRFVNGTAGGSC